MIDFGTVKPGTTLYIPFNTFDSNDPSASVTITGLATTDIEVYKDGSTTQRASDAGYALLDTDGIDFDTITGIHGISIDLADNTTAGFYASGSQYWVVVSSITVDAATVNFIAATFRIGQEDAILNTTIATLSSQTSFTLTSGPADDDALNGCKVLVHDVASAVQMCVGYVSDYTGSSKTVTLIADPGIFTMAATDNISVFVPDHTAAIADAVWDETLTGSNHNDVNSAGKRLRQVDAAFVVTEGTADAGGANTIDLETGVASTTDDIYNGDRILITAGTGVGEHGIINDYDGTTNQRATMAQNWVVAPDNTSEYIIVPADVDIESWQHVSVTTGATSKPEVDMHSISGDATAADNAEADYDGTGYNKANSTVGTVTTNTDMRGTDGAYTGTPPTAAAIVDAVWTEALADHSGTAGSTAEAIQIIDTNVDDIETIVTSGTVDANVVQIDSDATAATNLGNSALGIVNGTAITGTLSTTQFTTNLTEATNDHYNGRIVVFITGDLAGQASDITDYDGASKLITVTAMTEAPANNDTFVII